MNKSYYSPCYWQEQLSPDMPMRLGLLRFPATNGSDIVFSYAGDLYKAPLNGGEAQKLTSISVMKCSHVFLRMENQLLSPVNMTVTLKYI